MSDGNELVCQADGCNRDLAKEKPYYQRHRVCQEHIRALSVPLDGIECRFCQQCARFQVVEEFDGSKRSCRSRLQEHNARRRHHRPGPDDEIATPAAPEGSDSGSIPSVAAARAVPSSVGCVSASATTSRRTQQRQRQQQPLQPGNVKQEPPADISMSSQGLHAPGDQGQFSQGATLGMAGFVGGADAHATLRVDLAALLASCNTQLAQPQQDPASWGGSGLATLRISNSSMNSQPCTTTTTTTTTTNTTGTRALNLRRQQMERRRGGSFGTGVGGSGGTGDDVSGPAASFGTLQQLQDGASCLERLRLSNGMTSMTADEDQDPSLLDLEALLFQDGTTGVGTIYDDSSTGTNSLPALPRYPMGIPGGLLGSGRGLPPQLPYMGMPGSDISSLPAHRGSSSGSALLLSDVGHLLSGGGGGGGGGGGSMPRRQQSGATTSSSRKRTAEQGPDCQSPTGDATSLSLPPDFGMGGGGSMMRAHSASTTDLSIPGVARGMMLGGGGSSVGGSPAAQLPSRLHRMSLPGSRPTSGPVRTRMMPAGSLLDGRPYMSASGAAPVAPALAASPSSVSTDRYAVVQQAQLLAQQQQQAQMQIQLAQDRAMAYAGGSEQQGMSSALPMLLSPTHHQHQRAAAQQSALLAMEVDHSVQQLGGDGGASGVAASGTLGEQAQPPGWGLEGAASGTHDQPLPPAAGASMHAASACPHSGSLGGQLPPQQQQQPSSRPSSGSLARSSVPPPGPGSLSAQPAAAAAAASGLLGSQGTLDESGNVPAEGSAAAEMALHAVLDRDALDPFTSEEEMLLASHSQADGQQLPPPGAAAAALRCLADSPFVMPASQRMHPLFSSSATSSLPSLAPSSGRGPGSSGRMVGTSRSLSRLFTHLEESSAAGRGSGSSGPQSPSSSGSHKRAPVSGSIARRGSREGSEAALPPIPPVTTGGTHIGLPLQQQQQQVNPASRAASMAQQLSQAAALASLHGAPAGPVSLPQHMGGFQLQNPFTSIPSAATTAAPAAPSLVGASLLPGGMAGITVPAGPGSARPAYSPVVEKLGLRSQLLFGGAGSGSGGSSSHVWGGSLPPSSACSNASMSTRSDGFKLPADLSLSGDGSAGTRGSGGSSFNPPHPAIPPGLLATHPAMQSSSMQNRPYLDSASAMLEAISWKIAQCKPHELPPDLLARLYKLVHTTDLQTLHNMLQQADELQL